MNSGGAVRCRPPLLPSTSLSGLEQAIPPDRPSHSNVGPSWKFKPLPDLPTGASHEDSRDNTDNQVVHGGTGLPDDKHILFSERSRDDIQVKRSKDDASQRHNSPPRGRFLIQNASAGTRRRETAPKPSSSSQNGESSAFALAKPLHSDTSQGVPIIKVPVPSKQGRTATPATSDSVHPSLVPPPLLIDGTRVWDHREKSSPSLSTPEYSSFCRCQLRRSRHIHNFGSTEEPSNSANRWPRQGSTWQLSTPHLSSKQSNSKIKCSRRENIEGVGSRQSVGSQFPNRTQLYSFSSSSPSSNRETYNDDSDPDDEHNLNFTSNDETQCLTRPFPNSSSASQFRRHPHASRTFIHRRKQLAIPPTEYQKYGSKIWSLQNKQERAALFPRCVRKLLPRSWRPPGEKNEKSFKNSKSNAIYSQKQSQHQGESNNALPVGGTPSAMFSLTPPPRPPRPPSPPSRYLGLSSPSSLPALTNQRSLHTSDYVVGHNMMTTHDTNGFSHVAAMRALTPPLTGGSTVSAWSSSDEMLVQPPNHKNPAVIEGRRERADERKVGKRMKAKSEELLGVRRPRAVIDETGNFWL